MENPQDKTDQDFTDDLIDVPPDYPQQILYYANGLYHYSAYCCQPFPNDDWGEILSSSDSLATGCPDDDRPGEQISGEVLDQPGFTKRDQTQVLVDGRTRVEDVDTNKDVKPNPIFGYGGVTELETYNAIFSCGDRMNNEYECGIVRDYLQDKFFTIKTLRINNDKIIRPKKWTIGYQIDPPEGTPVVLELKRANKTRESSKSDRVFWLKTDAPRNAAKRIVLTIR